jgi:hypothetical protein
MGLIENIESGKYDAHLDRIIRACRARQADRIYNLSVGDRVKFTNTVRPTWLRGQPGTITSWRRSRLIVRLDIGREIIAHAAGLVPVEEVKNEGV